VNPIRRLLFGKGLASDELRLQLEAEGIVFFEEGLIGSVTLRHFRAPGKRANWERNLFGGVLALTRRRLVVWSSFKRAEPAGMQVDVPLGDPLFEALEISVEVEKNDRVLIAFDVAAFHPDWSGHEEVRMRTPNAAQFVELAEARRRAALRM
jgi:hypothetical protein